MNRPKLPTANCPLLTVPLLTVLLLAAGCDRSPEQTTRPVPAPPREELNARLDRIDGMVDDAELLEKIRKADDIFSLHELEEEFSNTGKGSDAVRDVLNEKYRKALAESDVMSFGDAMDLIAYDYRRVGEGRSQISLLIRANEQLNDDYMIGYLASVDKSHERLMPERFQRHKQLEEWWYPKTASWPAGHIVLLRKVIDVPDVPINVTVTVQNEKTRVSLGYRLALGWQADPDR